MWAGGRCGRGRLRRDGKLFGEMTMPSSAFILAVAAMAGQPTQAAPEPGRPSSEQADAPGGQNVVIGGGYDLRPLPFRLNLERRARPPRSLTEMVDRLYAALPEDRRDMFAAYYGGNEFERIRARYDSTVEFFYDLYTIEILHEAGRIWGFSEAYFPLGPARRCVGDDFVAQVAIQIGSRRLLETGTRGVPPPLRNTGGAYGMAARISRQLFALCDRLHPPRFRAR